MAYTAAADHSLPSFALAPPAVTLQRAGYPPDLALGALPYRSDQPMVSLPDLARLRATLDWQPRISLEQGIADLVQVELARCP